MRGREERGGGNIHERWMLAPIDDDIITSRLEVSGDGFVLTAGPLRSEERRVG